MSNEEEQQEGQGTVDPEIVAIKEEIKAARKAQSDAQKHVNNLCIRYGKLLAGGKKKKKRSRPTTKDEQSSDEKASPLVCGGNPFSDPPTPCPGTDKNRGSSTKLADGTVIQQCVSCKKAVTNHKRKEAKKAKQTKE